MKTGPNGEKIAETSEEEALLQQEEVERQKKASTDNESKLEDLIKNTLGESERARQALEARNRQLEDELRNSKKIDLNVDNTVKITKEQFWEDPVTSLNALISAQVNPLKATANELQRDREYSAIKNRFRVNPAFATIEPLVDEYMAGKEINNKNVEECAQRAIGVLVLQNPALLTGGTPPAKVEGDNKDKDGKIVGEIKPDPQAHLRPSKQVNNQSDKGPQRRALTELEKRIIKENPGMTEDRFFELLNGDTKVDSWKEKVK